MRVLCCKKQHCGIGLIEVLAALFVISVGVLGVAKMGGLAIANTGISARRSIATIQAGSLAAAMHADRGYWSVGGVAPASVSVNGSVVTNTALSGQSAICTAGTVCSPLQMAAYDVQQWANSLSNLLPGDIATIACSQTTNVPVTCTIQINWAEHTISLNNNASQNGTQQQPIYTLYVEP